MTLTTASIPIEVHLGPDDWAAALRHDAAGRPDRQSPKELSPTWFYDERGCELFDEITRLPEYYPTRAERAILADHAKEIVARGRARHAGRARRRHVGEDPRPARRHDRSAGCAVRALRRGRVDAARRRRGRRRPSTRASRCTASSATSAATSAHIPRGGRRMIAFLGGTIGNLAPAERAGMLGDAAAPRWSRATRFLLGTDLVKDRGRLVAAYDDAAGVTAAFNLNVLHVPQPRAGRRLRPRRSSATSPCSTRRTSGSRCGCGPCGDQTVHIAGARPRRRLRRRRGRCAPRSAPSSAVEGVDRSWPSPGCASVEWWTDDDGDFLSRPSRGGPA